MNKTFIPTYIGGKEARTWQFMSNDSEEWSLILEYIRNNTTNE